MKTISSIIFTLTFIMSAIFLFIQHYELTAVMTFAGIGILVGFSFVLGKYIESIKFMWDGQKISAEIKATVQEVHSDAEQIKSVLKEIQSQKEIIDLIVRDANISQVKVGEVEEIAKKAQARAENIESIVESVEFQAKKATDRINDLEKTFDKRAAKVSKKVLGDLFDL